MSARKVEPKTAPKRVAASLEQSKALARSGDFAAHGGHVVAK